MVDCGLVFLDLRHFMLCTLNAFTIEVTNGGGEQHTVVKHRGIKHNTRSPPLSVALPRKVE